MGPVKQQVGGTRPGALHPAATLMNAVLGSAWSLWSWGFWFADTALIKSFRPKLKRFLHLLARSVSVSLSFLLSLTGVIPVPRSVTDHLSSSFGCSVWTSAARLHHVCMRRAAAVCLIFEWTWLRVFRSHFNRLVSLKFQPREQMCQLLFLDF